MPDKPFFFTSYAVRRADSALVAEFHAKLEQEVQIKRGRTAATEGFLDTRSLGFGAPWRPQLVDAVGTTRLLIALLSDDYFDSEWCGREWAVMEERARRASQAGGRAPVAILPLFWVPVTRRLPDRVADLQYRAPRLGDAYANSCLIDVMRSDLQAYHKFVVELTDYMVDIAGLPLPELDADTVERTVPAFGPSVSAASSAAPSGAPVSAPPTQGPTSPVGGTVSDDPSTLPAWATQNGGRMPMSPEEKRRLINLLVLSDVGARRDAWDVFTDSIRVAIRPAQLNTQTDGGSARMRAVALVNFALRQRTPDVLLVLADAFEEQATQDAADAVRRLVEEAAAQWPEK